MRYVYCKRWIRLGWAYDDITGLQLDAKGVKFARQKEMQYVSEEPVWVKMTRADAKSRGLNIIKARWIDTNKGDDSHPIFRSRYVGKEFNSRPMDAYTGIERAR